jgi:ubiquinone/menaquinone biosynthesis C-methylase UbiE
MSSFIEPIAREYVYRRFSSASMPEKEKIINDWANKIEDSSALVRDFKERVGNPVEKKILDVGSGPGGVSIAFALAGAHVSGIDIEKELYDISILHAKEYGVNVDFFLYDGNHLPFRDNTFDYAVSVSVIEHTTDPELYLGEILRVVKPGGKLYLGFPNKIWPKETHTGIWFLTYLPSFLRPFVINLLKRNPLEENNLHFYTYFNLKKMLKKVKSESFSWYLVPEKGKINNGIKSVVKSFLGFFGVSYKAFLPHILVVLEKKN